MLLNFYFFIIQLQLPKYRKTHEAWVLLLVNHNLLPELRVKKENLIIAAVFPGPKPPKDLNSFLFPTMEQFVKLEKGVRTKKYDGTFFLLRVFILFFTGDLPGISKFLCFMGHNSYFGCRYCWLKGIYSKKHKHIYFVDSCGANREAPNRTIDELRSTVFQLNNAAGNSSLVKSIRQASGIHGESILFQLTSTKFPQSFPVDLMHLMINIIKIMFQIWIGEIRPSVNAQPAYLISQANVQIIGEKMVRSSRGIPGSMGHAPRNIAIHWRGFKAEEWKLWAVLYSAPLLKDANFPLLYL